MISIGDYVKSQHVTQYTECSEKCFKSPKTLKNNLRLNDFIVQHILNHSPVKHQFIFRSEICLKSYFSLNDLCWSFSINSEISLLMKLVS